MLIIVHHRNIEGALQAFLDIEALRGLNVLKVDAAKGWRNTLYSLTELLRVFLINFDVKYVYATVNLEKQALPFHYWLTTHGSNITESQHSCSVRNDCHKITLIRIFISIVRILLNLKTRISHTWRISQRKICLSTISLGGLYFNFARTP